VRVENAGGGEQERCRLRVEGQVQGVGFRAWTAWTARSLGLAGWVRNQPDGTVELEAEGASEAVARLRDAVSRGPELASVGRVRELEPGDGSLPRPFEIRYSLR
jgi:acylphosphatase